MTEEPCCGVKLTGEPAGPASVTNASCCDTHGAVGGTPHLELGKTELSANAFLIRRAEVLKRLPRNPYGVNFTEIGRARGIAVGRAPTPALNRVFGADLSDPDIVARFNEWFATNHAVPPYQVLGSGDRSASAPEGFTRLPGWEHVIQEKDNLEDNGVPPTPSEPVEIQEIGKDDTETFTRIYAEAFDYPAAIAQPLCRSAELLIGEPDVLSYVATISGEPVSVGQLFLSAHGAAFLGSTGTLPAARGAGCQAFLDRRRIADAKKAGYGLLCRTVAFKSQSWRNALKVGFRPVFREDIYAPSRLMDHLPKAADSHAAAHGGGCCSTELAAAGR